MAVLQDNTALHPMVDVVVVVAAAYPSVHREVLQMNLMESLMQVLVLAVPP